MSRTATPDQVIARHVREKRERHNLTVTQLSDRMQVSRGKIYDYEHRAGRAHAFKWAELIELCAALNCSVFELVLPDEGETVDVPEWVAQHIEPAPVPGALGAVMVTAPGREELSDTVFQMPAEILHPSKLDHLRQQWLDRQAEWLKSERQRFFDQLRELGAMTVAERQETK